MKIRKILVAILAAIMIINVSSPGLTAYANDIEDGEGDNDQSNKEYVKVTGVSTHIPEGTLGKDSDIYMEVSYITNIKWSRYFEVVYDVEGYGEQKFNSTTLEGDEKEQKIRIDLGKYVKGKYRLKRLVSLAYDEEDQNKTVYNYDSQTKKLINKEDSNDVIESGNCNYTVDGNVESGFTFEKMWLELPEGMTKDTVKEGTEFDAVALVKNNTSGTLYEDSMRMIWDYRSEKSNGDYDTEEIESDSVSTENFDFEGIDDEGDGLKKGHEGKIRFHIKLKGYMENGTVNFRNIICKTNQDIDDEYYRSRYIQMNGKLMYYQGGIYYGNGSPYNGEFDFKVSGRDKNDEEDPQITGIKKLTSGKIYSGEKAEYEVSYKDDASGVRKVELSFENPENYSSVEMEGEIEKAGKCDGKLVLKNDNRFNEIGTYQLISARIEDHTGKDTWYGRREDGFLYDGEDGKKLDISVEDIEVDYLKEYVGVSDIQTLKDGKEQEEFEAGETIDYAITIKNTTKEPFEFYPDYLYMDWDSYDVTRTYDGEKKINIPAGESQTVHYKVKTNKYRGKGDIELESLEYVVPDPDDDVSENTIFSCYFWRGVYYQDNLVEPVLEDSKGDFSIVKAEYEDTDAPYLKSVNVEGIQHIPGKIKIDISVDPKTIGYAPLTEVSLGLKYDDGKNDENDDFFDEDEVGGKYWYWPGSENEREKPQIKDKGQGEFEITFLLDNRMKSGNYKISGINLEDEAGNSRGYYCNNEGKLYNWDDEDNYIDNPIIIIENSNTDFSGPLLKDFEFLQDKNTDNNQLKVRMKVTDENGLSDVALYLAKDDGDYKLKQTALEKKENDEYIITYATDQLEDGKYKLSYIDLTDGSLLKNKSSYGYDEETNELYEFEGENKVSATGSCLYVVNRKEVVVTIKGNSKTAQYDGTEKNAEGYTVESIQRDDQDCADYTSEDFRIKNAGKATISGKDASSYFMGLKPEDFENINKDFQNVTFKVIDGQLNITKRNVTLTSASAEKSYDGQPLTNENIKESGDGFVEGEGATYTVTGSQTEVGTSKNTFSYKLNANTKADNYAITTAEGTLTVTKKKHAHTYKEIITKATPSKNGSKITKCTECGDIQKKEVIAYPKKATCATEYVYDGKAKKPEVTVTDANGKKVSKSNYGLSYTGNCKNVGTYTVKITFKNNYSGTLKKTFTVVPKGTNLESVKSGKKQIAVQWSKQNVQTTGYQLQYAADKAFKKNLKTVTINNNKVTSRKISKLAGKKKYYVKMRTYKKAAGKTYYSKWSTVKSVTTKK